jgi:hypothetical protein
MRRIGRTFRRQWIDICQKWRRAAAEIFTKFDHVTLILIQFNLNTLSKFSLNDFIGPSKSRDICQKWRRAVAEFFKIRIK